MTDPYKAVLDNEASAVARSDLADEMFQYYLDNGKEATFEAYDINEEQFLNTINYPQSEQYFNLEGINVDGIQSSSINPEIPGIGMEGINPEWEGEGITAEMIPGESAVGDAITWLAEKAGVPPEAALLMAGVTGKDPKKVKKGAEGLFSKKTKDDDFLDKAVFGSTKRLENAAHRRGKTYTPKMTKDGKPYKNNPFRTAKSGEVVKGTKGGSGVPVGDVKKGGVLSTKQTGVTKREQTDLTTTGKGKQAKLGLTDKNKRDAIAGTATGIGAVTALNLLGDRDEDGSLKVAALPKEEPKKEKVDLNKIAREDRSVGEENPWEGNQLGYHKRPGQNFWTVDDTDPYWDTHEMGTGSPWEEAEPKQVVQEFDFSKWFK